MKYIIVTGGVISGSGKGITAASLGKLLRARQLKVGIQKFDMYLNVDAGTLKPGKHGEVYVTADGAETDLDLGHYERFLDVELTQESSVMAGQVLLDIINRERAGGFSGDDVQMIPHVTDAIQDRIIATGQGHDVHIVELGGTVGDYESLAFVEAVRQLAQRVGPQNVFYVHLVYLPFLETSGEIKTKPAQNAVRDLRGIGIRPDILVARCERPPTPDLVDKLSLFTNLSPQSIIILQNAPTVYQVPLTLEAAGVGRRLSAWVGQRRRPRLAAWKKMVGAALTNYSQKVRIGMVAKYLDNLDTYMSLTQALQAAAWANKVDLDLVWVQASSLESLKPAQVKSRLAEFDGLVVPGGFGQRGVEGMIVAAQSAMTCDQPYLGICLGMQVGVIGFARNNGLPTANSKEFKPDGRQLVITFAPNQKGKLMTGGTMRLGNYPCHLKKGSLAAKIYNKSLIYERHRHRFEFNAKYQERLEESGLVISGRCPDNDLVEIIELPDHPFFLGCQFHPEFTSRPARPHPLFCHFILAAKMASK